MEREPILVEREKTHGSFKRNAQIWQAICLMARDTKFVNDAQRCAFNMIALKIGRLLQNPSEPDHWKDLSGYSKLGLEACDDK